MSKKISLSRGLFATVDDEDFDAINKFKWHASKNGYTNYAHRMIRVGGKQTCIKMHRMIMNPPTGMMVDHLDGDGLNNTKQNLRIVDYKGNRQNRRNFKCHPDNKVSYSKRSNKWIASIQIGVFDSKEEAQRAKKNALERLRSN